MKTIEQIDLRILRAAVVYRERRLRGGSIEQVVRAFARREAALGDWKAWRKR